MFTKKHFIETAKVIGGLNAGEEVIKEITDSFSRMFKSYNCNFDKARFEAYIKEVRDDDMA